MVWWEAGTDSHENRLFMHLKSTLNRPHGLLEIWTVLFRTADAKTHPPDNLAEKNCSWADSWTHVVWRWMRYAQTLGRSRETASLALNFCKSVEKFFRIYHKHSITPLKKVNLKCLENNEREDVYRTGSIGRIECFSCLTKSSTGDCGIVWKIEFVIQTQSQIVRLRRQSVALIFRTEINKRENQTFIHQFFTFWDKINVFWPPHLLFLDAPLQTSSNDPIPHRLGLLINSFILSDHPTHQSMQCHNPP
jgi:hypothetical protein